MFSWRMQASVETDAEPRAIWNQWTKVSDWPKWDEELEWCELNGPFSLGTTGKLKPKGFMAMPFILTAVEPEAGYSDITKLPLTKIVFKHSIEKLSQKKVRVTHQVHVYGLLAPLLKLTMGKSLKKGLPKAILKLTQMAKHEQTP